MYQAAGAVLAVLRRFRKTYPPMPERRSSEAATWPGSGIALDDGAIPFGFTEMKVGKIPTAKSPRKLPEDRDSNEKRRLLRRENATARRAIPPMGFEGRHCAIAR